MTQTAQHTPRSWHTEKTARCHSTAADLPYEILDADGLLVAEVCAGQGDALERATLIAAAPDLLAACKIAFGNLDALLHGQRRRIGDLELGKLLRAAIDKAERMETP